VRVGFCVAIVTAVVKLVRARREDRMLAAPPTGRWPVAGPADDQPAPPPERAWVEPDGDVCPLSHPIKAKLRSGLFHLPGMLAYDRTRPDRCYANEEAATADGLTRAKR
jgi:hypothetical protein